MLVNLWHGIPLKKIEFDIENGPLSKLFKRPSFGQRYIFSPYIFRRPDFVLSTSASVSRRAFSSAFRVSQEQCLSFGYPRTDLFFKEHDERIRFLNKWSFPQTRALVEKLKEFDRCYIYMPTWRDAKPDFIRQSGWEFQALNEILQSQNSLLLLKLHVATPPETLRGVVNLSNIHLVPSTEDVYSILPYTSGLITDYSSIAFDYFLLDKPIYYYAFDLHEYESDSRGFYYKYQDCIAGRLIASPVDFLKFDPGKDAGEFAATRTSLTKEFFAHADSLSAERIVQKMKSNF